MSIRSIVTSKSGKGKRGWLWMPISLVLHAVSPGGTHLAAAAAADPAPERPRRDDVQIPAPTATHARQSPSGGHSKVPDRVRPAAFHPAIPRIIERPIAVPADLPDLLRKPVKEAEAGFEADHGTGEESAVAGAGIVIAEIPGGVSDGVPDQVPAGAQGPLHAGFRGVCNPALIEASRIPPSYPELARQAGVQGKVLLQAVIREDGTVGNITVLEGSRERLGFEEAAVNAVSQWRYKPGLQDGRPVDAHVTILVDFSPPH